MKFDLKLRAGSKSSEHQLESAPFSGDGAGRLRFVLDGQTIEALAEAISPGTYSILVNGRSFPFAQVVEEMRSAGEIDV